LKKFHFQYDNILEFKKKKENAMVEKLNNCLCELQLASDILNQFIANKSNSYENMNQLMIHGTDVLKVKEYSSFILGLNNRINDQKSLIETCNIKIDKVRQELLQVSKEVKIFEKLKDNHKVEYKFYEKKEEEKFVDQLVTYGSYRGK